MIYEKLAEIFKGEWEITPFCNAYEKMLMKTMDIGVENMPNMKEGQNSNISGEFFRFFSSVHTEMMKRILDTGKYIPQEILSEKDF